MKSTKHPVSRETCSLLAVTDKVSPVSTDSSKAMFNKFCILMCLLLSFLGKVTAQTKAETPNASRAILARPPQSGKEPMLLLGPKNKPYSEPLLNTTKMDYYECDGIVAPWFRELLVAEMNYFAELNELPFVKGDAYKGYLEDRRPNSQGDPYAIASQILKTIASVPKDAKVSAAA